MTRRVLHPIERAELTAVNVELLKLRSLENNARCCTMEPMRKIRWLTEILARQATLTRRANALTWERT